MGEMSTKFLGLYRVERLHPHFVLAEATRAATSSCLFGRA